MKLRKLMLVAVALSGMIVLAATNSQAQDICCQPLLHELHCSSPGCSGSIYYESCQEVTNGVWAGGPNNVGCCSFTEQAYQVSNNQCYYVAPVALVRSTRVEEHYTYFRTCSGKYVILHPQVGEYIRSAQAGS